MRFKLLILVGCKFSKIYAVGLSELEELLNIVAASKMNKPMGKQSVVAILADIGIKSFIGNFSWRTRITRVLDQMSDTKSLSRTFTDDQ